VSTRSAIYHTTACSAPLAVRLIDSLPPVLTVATQSPLANMPR